MNWPHILQVLHLAGLSASVALALMWIRERERTRGGSPA